MISPSFPHGAAFAPHFNRKNRVAPGRREGDDLERGSYGSQSRDRGAGVFSSASFFFWGLGRKKKAQAKMVGHIYIYMYVNMAMKYDEI